MKKNNLITLPNYLPATIFGGVAPIQSIDHFIAFANAVPMLEEGEEKELAERLKQHNDLAAAQRLVLSHLRFVIKIARSFNGYGLQLADLIQEGSIGLMKAVKRFDPTMGVRLASFAVHWIKSEIHEFVIRNWRLVKIATTKAQRKLFFNLRSQKTRLGWFTKEEVADVAKELNVKPSDVMEMEQRLNSHDISLEGSDDEDGDEFQFSPIQYLASPDLSPENEALSSQQHSFDSDHLKAGMEHLDARSQDIITQRWLVEKKATLHQLAAKYSISAERVRQLETQAMNQLKQALAA